MITPKYIVSITAPVCALLLSGSLAEAQSAIVEYNFNEGGTTAINSGLSASISGAMRNASNSPADLHGVAGSGVSGALNDYAFDNTAASGMGAAGGMVKMIAPTDFTGMTSFTLAGWFKTDGSETIGSSARLFDWTNGANGFILSGGSTPGQLVLSINGVTTATSTTSYASQGSWVFFAVTYDTQSVKFYEGSSSATASLVYSKTISGIGAVKVSTNNLIIGNNSAVPTTRAFDGLLDNMAIFGSATDSSGALSVGAIQDLQASALAVPEPATHTMVLGGLLSLIAFSVRRKLRRLHA